MPKRPLKKTANSSGRSLKKRKRSVAKKSIIRSARVGSIRGRNPAQVLQKPRALRPSGYIPPWQTLPYSILLRIFQIAAHPVTDESLKFSGTKSVHWLLRTALLCRSFCEPALSVLYYAPPFLPEGYMLGIWQTLLRSQSGLSTINYQAKIKYIDIDATSALLRSRTATNTSILGEIVKMTTRLQGLSFHLASDHPRTKRWMESPSALISVYGDDWILPLIESGIKLETFTWNFFCNKRDLEFWTRLPEYNALPTFLSLKRLVISKFNKNEAAPQRDQQIKILSKALGTLHCLEDLTFNQCFFDIDHQLANDALDHVPENLKSLRFIDCDDLESERLARVLVKSGRILRELVLNYNRSLNLEFLPDLSTICPNLEIFSADFTIYGGLVGSDVDREPKFSKLLSETSRPSWPSSLQSLELNNMRNLTAVPAGCFFESLAEGAAGLPDLRRISIKAGVDCAWRERIRFRDKWEERLRHIYKRRPHIIKKIITGKSVFFGSDFLLEPGNEGSPEAMSLGGSVKYKEKDSDSDSDTPLSSRTRRPRRSARLPNKKDSIDLPSKRSTRGSERQSAAKAKFSSEVNPDLDSVYVQGMCYAVDIRIDNLRPMETQYHEEDFLDAELPGDNEYRGNR